MAEEQELIAWHPQDFENVGAMYRDWTTTVRPQAGVQTKKRRSGFDSARVMCLGPDYPLYTPRETQRVAYFLHDSTNETVTLEFFGTDLAGLIDVWIDGVLYRTDCQIQTADARAWFGFDMRRCRVTIFPGLWEFAFAGVAPDVWAEPGPGSSDVRTFRGGIAVWPEAWRSVQTDAGEIISLEITDMTPFAEGEVKPGAIAKASWSNSVPSGWLVEKWLCREFAFYPASNTSAGTGGIGASDGSSTAVVDGETTSEDPETVDDPPPVEDP